MPLDPEARNRILNAVPPPVVEDGRAARSLGRGLEEISHLFLTQRQSEEPVERPEPSPEVISPPAPRPRAVVLKAGVPFTREHLMEALRQPNATPIDTLRVLDAGLPCSPCGEMDLLAVDRANQLAIIDLETVHSDGLLLRGISHFDWLVRNLPNVRRMYRDVDIDYSAQPRLFLLAPQFSAFLRSAVRQISRPEIHCVRYHVLNVGGDPGIFFEHVGRD